MTALLRALAPALLCFAAAAQQPGPSGDLPSLVKTADAAYAKGDYEAARQSLLSAWELLQASPPENPARYDVLKRLTSVRSAAGELSDADSWLQKAMEWRKSVFGADDPKIADDLLVEAGIYHAMKQPGAALALFPQILSSHIRANGFDSVRVADDYSRMAQILLGQSRSEDAAGALDVALEIRGKLARPLDPSLLPDLDHMGTIQVALRNYERAASVYRRALVIRETYFGKDSSELLGTLDGLAYACFGEKNYDEAEPFYQRLLALWIATAGEEHPMIALTLDKIATFYTEQKKFDQARAANDRSNIIRAYFLANGLSVQAAEQEREGNAEAADALVERVLKVLDPLDPKAPVGADLFTHVQQLRASAEQFLKGAETPKPPSPPQPKKPAPARKK